MFCAKPGAVRGMASGRTACDHYNLFRQDIGLMQEIGLQAYRFSVSWPRVLPEGEGRVNEKGLAFYDQLIDALLEAGIEPVLTLFHWDFPLALYRRGGWLNRQSADWFADYAALLGGRFGDRVKWWVTQNEPQCFIGAGHLDGAHAPGDKLPMREALVAMHHTLLAHGRAVQALRAACPAGARIGYSHAWTTSVPQTESAEDIAAARESFFRVEAGKLWGLSLWADPMYLGHYPKAAYEVFGADMPEHSDADMRTIHQPLDYLGSNIYSGVRVSRGPGGEIVSHPQPAGMPTGMMTGFELEDESLYWSARFQTERYGRLPFIVTENGFCGTDWTALDGRVHDPQRIDFIERYLRGLLRARDEGIPVGGYFYWSLLDNFEWAEGYRPRFGLIHVDYATQRRTLKDSALWYRQVIASDGKSARGAGAAERQPVTAGADQA
jgi:beta-glucosidase